MLLVVHCVTQLTFAIAPDFTPPTNQQFCYFKKLNVTQEPTFLYTPLLSLQNTRIYANFGSRPFVYAEGTEHRKAADECHDVTQDIKDTFGALPFHLDSDSDDSTSSSVTNSGSHARLSPRLSCRTAVIPKSLRGMSTD